MFNIDFLNGKIKKNSLSKLSNFESCIIFKIEQFRIFDHFSNSSIGKLANFSNVKFLGMRVKILNGKTLECQTLRF